jgi:hypothetical protein
MIMNMLCHKHFNWKVITRANSMLLDLSTQMMIRITPLNPMTSMQVHFLAVVTMD